MFFAENSSYPIGLDISDLSLKLVQLNATNHRLGRANDFKIQALGKVNLPSGLINNGEVLNQEEVAKIIRKLINKPKFGNISTDMVVACLPETKAFIKLIEIAKTPNNLSDIIEPEIEKHVPMSIDEIYYDWQVIEDNGETESVLIGASPKKIVNQYTSLLDQAKLTVEALEIEPIAICRALLREESKINNKDGNNNYAIIDFGASRTSLIMYSKKTILFTVSMPISGEEVTSNIVKNLQLDKGQAEKAKIICGLDKAKAQGIIHKILSSTIDKLNKKIIDSFEFYSNYYSDRGPIDNILLCGGGANIKNIDQIISQAVSVPVHRGDALVNLGEAKGKFLKLLSETYNLDINFTKKNKLGSKKESKASKNNNLSITQDSSLSFATAVGLALRGIFVNKI